MVDVEVLIIGAGPAGSAAALLLARSGIDVLIADRHQFPRTKVCGDLLIPDTIDMLKKIGLYSKVYREGCSLSDLRFFAPNDNSVLLKGEFITIRRIVFDNILCTAAIDAGARHVWNFSFDNCIPNNAHYKVQFRDGLNEKHDITARYLILATGANPLPLKNIGLLQRSKPSGIGIRRYVTVSERPEKELIISYEKFLLPGYAWIFPLGEGMYNVGCGLSLEGSHQKTKSRNLSHLFHRFVTESPIARELLSNPKEQSPLEGAQLRTGFIGSLPGDGSILVVGEALGLTYPLSGAGIGKSMQSGELAAKVILAHRNGNCAGKPLDLYYTLLEEELRNKYQPYTIAQKWLEYPSVANLVITRSNKRESLRKSFEDIIREKVEPTRIFSLWGLMKIALGLK